MKTWQTIIAENMNSMDFGIVATILGIVFFMKYDQRTTNSTGHKYIAACLGVGFLMLVGFRIYKGL